jgi:hypothetical protein
MNEFKVGDSVYVDYPEYFKVGKQYTIKKVSDYRMEFEGTRMVAATNHLRHASVIDQRIKDRDIRVHSYKFTFDYGEGTAFRQSPTFSDKEILLDYITGCVKLLQDWDNE